MSESILVKEKTSFSGANIYRLQVNTQTGIVVNQNPFGNCQSWSIKHFNAVIAGLKDISNMKKVIADIKEKCNVSKALLIVDLNRTYYDRVKEHVTFHSVTPYTNTNNSDMLYCVIDTRK